jgi:nitrate/TMAO reductase-like tetraheme cytochrome c subunit
MRKVFSILLIGFIAVLFACEKEDGEEVEGQSNVSGTSHNTGRNCLSCHQFTAAGSVYNKALTTSYPGANVKLTLQANGAGTVLGTFTVNKSGSFYTSSSINYGSGIYVSVTGNSGTAKYMTSAITTGACNSCHGSSTSKIWAE